MSTRPTRPTRCPRAPRPARPARRGFLLLEVVLSLTILGMAAIVLLRAYTIGVNTVKKSELITTAAMLAETLVDERELEGFEVGRTEGGFGENFPGFSWRTEVEAERLRYDYVTGTGSVEDIEPLLTVTVTIYYLEGREKPYVPVHFAFHPLRIESFSQKAKFENQIY